MKPRGILGKRGRKQTKRLTIKKETHPVPRLPLHHRTLAKKGERERGAVGGRPAFDRSKGQALGATQDPPFTLLFALFLSRLERKGREKEVSLTARPLCALGLFMQEFHSLDGREAKRPSFFPRDLVWRGP